MGTFLRFGYDRDFARPLVRNGRPRRRVQSHYMRRPGLPLGGRQVELTIMARRFWCDAVLCGRRVFCVQFEMSAISRKVTFLKRLYGSGGWWHLDANGVPRKRWRVPRQATVFRPAKGLSASSSKRSPPPGQSSPIFEDGTPSYCARRMDWRVGRKIQPNPLARNELPDFPSSYPWHMLPKDEGYPHGQNSKIAAARRLLRRAQLSD